MSLQRLLVHSVLLFTRVSTLSTLPAGELHLNADRATHIGIVLWESLKDRNADEPDYPLPSLLDEPSTEFSAQPVRFLPSIEPILDMFLDESLGDDPPGWISERVTFAGGKNVYKSTVNAEHGMFIADFVKEGSQGAVVPYYDIAWKMWERAVDRQFTGEKEHLSDLNHIFFADVLDAPTLELIRWAIRLDNVLNHENVRSAAGGYVFRPWLKLLDEEEATLDGILCLTASQNPFWALLASPLVSEVMEMLTAHKKELKSKYIGSIIVVRDKAYHSNGEFARSRWTMWVELTEYNNIVEEERDMVLRYSYRLAA